MAAAGPAFALARPATLGGLPAPRCASTVRRRPRVRAAAAGAQPKHTHGFPERAMSLARSAIRPGLLGGYDVADEVGAELRLLGANCGADLAFAVLRDGGGIPPLWREALYVFVDVGVTAEALDRAIDRIGLRALISIEPPRARRVLSMLTEQLALSKGKLRSIVTRAPAVLAADERGVQCVLDVLLGNTANLTLRLNRRDVQDAAVRWPIILLADPRKAYQVVKILQERALRGSMKRFICRAPYVLLYDVETTILPAIEWMNWCGLNVERIVRSCPMVLGCSTSALDAVKSFINVDVGNDDVKKVNSMLQSFPPLLVASVDTTLRPALRFLRVELGLARDDVADIVRAFPATLTLDVDSEMSVNVEYFRGRGIENVCQIVKHLPPILSYDLNKDIVPKMRFFEHALKFSPHEILQFPAYFSYKLHERIIPRTLFLIATGEQVKSDTLTITLSLTDEEFCHRVANRPIKEYHAFEKRLGELRKRSLAQRQQIVKTQQQLNGPTALTRIVHKMNTTNSPTRLETATKQNGA